MSKNVFIFYNFKYFTYNYEINANLQYVSKV